MKTMAVVTHHRNQCYGQSNPRFADRFGSHHSGTSCRNFGPGAGILPSPPLAVPISCHSPRCNPPRFRSEPRKSSKQSKPIAISPKPSKKRPCFDEESSCSEFWAGPVCLNSPPPSSLPIPKFSIPQKRSVSLDLPLPLPGIELQPLVMSAPTSPTRDAFSSATENLRRILQLDS